MIVDDWSFRAVCLPYCIQKQDDGKYALLNRNYKPLGFYTDKMVLYTDYPEILIPWKITEDIAKKISVDDDPCTKAIYLYGDRSVPMQSGKYDAMYRERLALLDKIKMNSLT